MKTQRQGSGVEERRIREIVEAWARAVRAGDLSGIMAHHARDILLFDVPPPVQVRGADGYRASWNQFFRWSDGAAEFDVRELEITAGEEVAYGHGLIRCAGKGADGERETLTVRLTICLRRIDGEWLVAHEHHSEPSGDP